MNFIEETLFEKTKDFQEGQVYSDQWKFAKSYMPKVLDTISQVFPHYSLHNSTHSEAIINNIVRIIGKESIKKLSVVDLWLLLAAAYYHDCGMVVSGEDKMELFKEGSEFVKYVDEMQRDTSSSMNQYAVLFDIKDDKIFFKNEQLTQVSYEAARFLLAGFVRNKHAERSGNRIELDRSLHFPGDPIPDRIIRILKSICDCHTKDVNEVMKLQLIESSGCGVEDCHPRFVAAMLRLGDLLDVDSNRVSEVLLSTLGSIPSDSKFYSKTNRSITHIRIDQSVVEITAECDDYQVADLINRWLQWLNDELVFYMKRWHMIIPYEGFGYLPTVGDLKVNLSNYDTFDGKKRPSFEIDSTKAIELLQGAGLYTDSCECIRELLQNAVDATYLRVYKENPGIKTIQEFKSRCAQYPIVVKLNKVSRGGAKNEEVLWKIEISDNGIGMTKEDLRYLSRTGSSGRNDEKRELIASVPEFMWPSGTFGIGFQRVFLITDQVNIVTRKVNKDHYLRAELHNPSGKEKGAILIQSVDGEDVGYGTSLTFEFKEAGGEHELIAYEDRYSFSEFLSFDFAKNKDMNIMGMKVMDEIARFASGTFVHVDFYLDDVLKKYVTDKTRVNFDSYDEETGIQICIDKLSPVGGELQESKVYYRNQWVRYYNPEIPFLSFHLNVLKGNAKDVLSLDRNRIRREYESELVDNIKITVIKYLNKKIEGFDTKRKQLASMCLEMYGDFIKEKQIEGISARDYWKAFELSLNNDATGRVEKMPLCKALRANKIERISRELEPDLLVFDIDGVTYSMSYKYRSSFRLFSFIIRIAQQDGFCLSFKKGGYLLSKMKCSIIESSDEAREERMYWYLRSGDRARGLFPCDDKYAALMVNKQAFSKYVDINDTIDYPRMVCPYVRKYDLEHADDATSLVYDVDQKVINTVYENRLDKSVTRNQIKEAYELFREEWAAVVERVNAKVKKEPAFPYRVGRYRILV